MTRGIGLFRPSRSRTTSERLEEHIVSAELENNTPDDTCLLRFHDAVERAFGISFAPIPVADVKRTGSSAS